MVRFFAVLTLLTAATGCGPVDPHTTVFVRNESRESYVVSFIHESDGAQSYWLVEPLKNGVTLNILGNVSGTVILYSEGCGEKHDEFSFAGGAVSVTVRDDAFVDENPGLPANGPMGLFSWTPECP